MKEYRRIGDLVDLIDERNKDEKVKTLIGVSIDKCFIKSVANTIGTDLSKYQVIRKFDFACSLMQVSRDGKIPIACLKDYDEAIMSPAYYIFRIKNTEEILPDYMAMWFMRPEFDREASYIAVGGVRGSMPWEDFCDMKLPVPDIKEQQKIVDTYNAITNRIQIKQKINENLEKTAQAIYRKMFIEDTDNLRKETLDSIYDFQYGKGNNNPDNGGKYPIYGSNGVIGGFNEYNNEDAPVVGHIGVACGSLLFAFGKHYVTYNGIMCNIKKSNIKYFGYWTMNYLNLRNEVRGSAQPFISYDLLNNLKFNYSTEQQKIEFDKKVTSIMDLINVTQRELFILNKMKTLIISQISKR